MRNLGAKLNPYISVKVYLQRMYSTREMKGIQLFIYFGRNFPNYEMEDGPVLCIPMI